MQRFPLSPSDPETWIPNADIFIAKDGGLVVLVEVAGLSRENVELTREGNHLKICGERPDTNRRLKYEDLATTLRYGPFESTIDIPPEFDLRKAKASYNNGILRIDVPRKPD